MTLRLLRPANFTYGHRKDSRPTILMAAVSTVITLFLLYMYN